MRQKGCLAAPRGSFFRHGDKGALCFCLLEAGLYLGFLRRDLGGLGSGTSTVLKYAAICLCFLWSLRGREGLLCLGLGLTVCADTFLLLLDRWYPLGVACFLGVQLVYRLRLSPLDGTWGRYLGWVLGSWGALLLLLGATGELKGLSAGAALYLAIFLQNLRLAFRAPRGPGRRFAWGLLLYLLCDVCVGIYNLPGRFPARVETFAGFGMWLFYLPGQVLIALSGGDSLMRGGDRHESSE